jgi:SHS family lactate transporter-like MFS transporter
LLFQYIGWRGMFMVGVIPALLVFYIRRKVPESPSWRPTTSRSNTFAIARALAARHLCRRADDGIQFLQPRHAGSLPDLPSGPAWIFASRGRADAVIYNIGAIVGGLFFGAMSERFGRRRIIILTALLSLAVLPLWAFSTTAVWLAAGAFLMQVMVQGAWGVIPVHLNELSPDDARGTFPGFVYQVGNLIASVNATLQAAIATHYGGNYALALALVGGIVAVIIVILAALGSEAKGVAFGNGAMPAAAAASAAR